ELISDDNDRPCSSVPNGTLVARSHRRCGSTVVLFCDAHRGPPTLRGLKSCLESLGPSCSNEAATAKSTSRPFVLDERLSAPWLAAASFLDACAIAGSSALVHGGVVCR